MRCARRGRRTSPASSSPTWSTRRCSCAATPTGRRLEQRPQYFHAAAAIANSAGIYYLTRALDFGKMPATLATLEAHWRELGLSERAA